MSENQIAALHQQIEELRQQVSQLTNQVNMLTICKAAHPPYAYFNWKMGNRVTEEDGYNISTFCNVLSHTVKNTPMNETFERMIHASLLAFTPFFDLSNVTYAKITSFIEDHFTLPEEATESLLESMYSQGMFKELCEHVLKDKHNAEKVA